MTRKRIRYLFRYITSPYRQHHWFNIQTLIIVLIVAAFAFSLAWPYFSGATGTYPANEQQAVQATLPPVPGQTRKATLSAEYLANSEQTVGITLVGAVLVLIVVIGLLVYMPHHEKS